MGGIPYLIVDVADDYSTCIIGVPDRKYIWIMARTPAVGPTVLHILKQKAQSLGYDINTLEVVPQSSAGDCTNRASSAGACPKTEEQMEHGVDRALLGA